MIDEEKGPYADFLDHITKLRVKMLNTTFEFAQKLTIEELEDDIREDENKDFMEGRSTHFFSEITAILEYLPEGFEAEEETEEVSGAKESPEPALEEIPDIEESVDDDIETDETMKWDEEEEEEDTQSDSYEETTTPPES